MKLNFKTKYESLVKDTDDLSTALFALGVLGRYGVVLPQSAQNLYNPANDRLISQIDCFTDVLLGFDSDDPGGILNKRGIDFNLYQLEKAIKFERPAWAFFFLTGEVLGRTMAWELTMAEFNMYLDKLPQQFMKDHQEKLLSFIDYFYAPESRP